MIKIIQNRKISFVISSVLFVASVILLIAIGLKPGIDFTGGSLLEVSFSDTRPTIDEVQNVLAPLDLGNLSVQPVDEDGMILKMRFISEEEHQAILDNLRNELYASSTEVTDTIDTAEDTQPQEVSAVVDDNSGTVTIEVNKIDIEARMTEKRIETIGSSISSQLRSRAWQIGLLVVFAIIIYVAYAFRKVSKPVKSWKFGLAAIIALVHDVTITMGIFVLLGHFYGVEVNISFVVALLTILGYSVNDTIVVFDRIRENLIKHGYNNFEELVNNGVNETLTRSLNTSMTTILVLATLFFYGGDSVKYFALSLIVGIFIGTYSSIFLASPILVAWERWKYRD
ncbi:MAG: protein translocase subunit SecF [Candidatus Magasanikbacteria bacterium CG_4_10_14_0_2_um_filter_37_12]|uniref:Protein-export membrane protein SecF n=1 Tax=Candidatus Magasanikbacteria bacterium CG_4_10_14_0_2_um_filter_37_12 TaxID=1974637 RepID=A0A2M7V902_9BACT|nr:MAG: protein translocase subunit SecF [Candidatus Magasanikbacteria bacterium CG_4_10_14_0_2_um_filter_37_12]